MTTALTPIAERTSLLSPLGPDAASRAQLVTLLQGIANRGEWASKSLIVPYSKSVNMGGNDYPQGLSYATIQDTAPIVASFALTVKAGDLVLLFASGSIIPTVAADHLFGVRWYDGTSTLSECRYKKGAAWAPGTNEEWPLNLHGSDIVSADGSKTYSLQAKVGDVALLVQGGVDYLTLTCVHIKLGAA